MQPSLDDSSFRKTWYLPEEVLFVSFALIQCILALSIRASEQLAQCSYNLQLALWLSLAIRAAIRVGAFSGRARHHQSRNYDKLVDSNAPMVQMSSLWEEPPGSSSVLRRVACVKSFALRRWLEPFFCPSFSLQSSSKPLPFESGRSLYLLDFVFLPRDFLLLFFFWPDLFPRWSLLVSHFSFVRCIWDLHHYRRM